MSYVPTCKISIGTQIELNFVTDITIESSFKNFTDTAEIKIPRKIRIAGEPDGIKKYIKQGDQVKIELGYDGNLNTEFEGFVSSLKPNIPISILCEDYMYQLKRVKVSNSWKEVTLQDYVGYLVNQYNASGRPQITFECESTSVIGAFILDNVSVARSLEILKETTGFVAFFRSNRLYVGFPYKFDTGRKEKYKFGQNVAASNLEYRLTEDVVLNVTATAFKKDGTKISVNVGDPDGDKRTLTYYNITDVDQLKAQAENELNQLKKTGYRGSITGFGIPFVQHGDIATIINDEYPEREGDYLIDKTTVNFGVDGFRRISELGKSV